MGPGQAAVKEENIDTEGHKRGNNSGDNSRDKKGCDNI